MTGGIAMDLLGGDTDANAYLLAVSAVLTQTAPPTERSRSTRALA